MTQPTLTTYGGALHDIGYAGQLVDMNIAEIKTFTNDQATAIDFGRAVARSAADNTCKAPTADAQEIIGISVRHSVVQADSSGNVVYAQNASVPVLRKGTIYVVAFENATRGDAVTSVTAQNGKLGSGATAVTDTGVSAAKSGGNTGNGTFVMDATTPVLANAQSGIYTARVTVAGTNTFTMEVRDPTGDLLGTVVQGGTFANQVKFVPSDGSTDFIVGDGFDITVVVNPGNVLLPGAKWDTTTAAGEIGIIRVNF